jgi:hypothetical protein
MASLNWIFSEVFIDVCNVIGSRISGMLPGETRRRRHGPTVLPWSLCALKKLRFPQTSVRFPHPLRFPAPDAICLVIYTLACVRLYRMSAVFPPRLMACTVPASTTHVVFWAQLLQHIFHAIAGYAAHRSFAVNALDSIRHVEEKEGIKKV